MSCEKGWDFGLGAPARDQRSRSGAECYCRCAFLCEDSSERAETTGLRVSSLCVTHNRRLKRTKTLNDYYPGAWFLSDFGFEGGSLGCGVAATTNVFKPTSLWSPN